MGFLSEWEGTKRIGLDDLVPGAATDANTNVDPMWWVDVKKSLTQAEAEKLNLKLAKSLKIGANGRSDITAEVTLTNLFDTVLASVTAWNLTDGDGNVLPYEDKGDLATSLRRLPAIVYERIGSEVMKANSVSSEEVSSFLAGRQGGDEVGENAESDHSEVMA